MPRGVYVRKKKINDAALHAMPRMSLVVNETDAQIDQRLRQRFDVLEIMSKSACRGDTRAMIVSGPAGLGKSFTVERAVEQYDNSGKKAVICKGFIRPSGLYKTLYAYRHPGNVIVFDDCDSVFQDADALNLLKAACDTTERRRIMWGAETRMTDDAGTPLPWSFEFEGSIIFITNFDFDYGIESGSKLTEHFKALVSRAHYIDTGMKTVRDYLVRIKQVVDAGMLSDRGLSKSEEKEIVDYIFTHAPKLRELTLRVVIKLASLYVTEPKQWRDIAKITLHRPA
jgi:hypothetical protein